VVGLSMCYMELFDYDKILFLILVCQVPFADFDF